MNQICFLIMFVSLSGAFCSMRNEIYKKGDVMLGGLFPMHEKSRDAERDYCGEKVNIEGIQLAEAMLFAVNQINKNRTRFEHFGNRTLGAYIRDSCSSPRQALHMGVEFTDDFNKIDNTMNKFKGVVIIDEPSTVIPVTNLLSKLDVVQIAPRENDDLPEDFPTLVNITPPHNTQGEILGKIVLAMNISAISIISSPFEEESVRLLIDEVNQHNVSVNGNFTFPVDATENDFKDILQKISKATNSTPKYVVLLMEGSEAKRVLDAAANLARRGVQQQQEFQWMACDGWGTKHFVINKREKIALGAITIEPFYPQETRYDGFIEHLNKKSQTDRDRCWQCPYLKKTQRCDNQVDATGSKSQNSTGTKPLLICYIRYNIKLL